MPLADELRIDRPDDFFEALTRAHHGLDAEACRALDAKLILLLANQIGNLDVLLEALEEARGTS